MRKRLCFVHIPKCGGTSINEAFRKSLHLSALSLRSGKVDAAKTRKESEKKKVDLLTLRQEKLVKHLQKKHLRYVKGHVRCTDEVRSRFEDQWVFVTVLRDPVKRWISQYFFNVHKKNDHFKHDLSLDAYLDSDDGVKIGSQYVDFFTDGTDLRSPEGIQKAIDNLSKFSIVGILEEMESFTSKYEDLFGKHLIIGNRNINPLSKDRITKEVTDSQMKRIVEICQPDMEIYNHFKSNSGTGE